jgi:hypothetical protein
MKDKLMKQKEIHEHRRKKDALTLHRERERMDKIVVCLQ